MKKQRVSSAVIRRLPRYYRQLDDLFHNGTVRISSGGLGKAMALTPSQIRQDLSCFGEFGQQGYGYNVERLRGEISEILGMNEKYTAVIIGAGNLGRALIENFAFHKYGFRLCCAFDVNPAIVGTEIAGVPIFHINDFEDCMSREPASVGVLTVPRGIAMPVAERLVAAGVKGIWNFTNIELELSAPDVVIEDVHFADSLLALSYMIGE